MFMRTTRRTLSITEDFLESPTGTMRHRQVTAAVEVLETDVPIPDSEFDVTQPGSLAVVSPRGIAA